MMPLWCGIVAFDRFVLCAGEIPIEVCRLRTLKYLDLRCNQLTGKSRGLEKARHEERVLPKADIIRMDLKPCPYWRHELFTLTERLAAQGKITEKANVGWGAYSISSLLM